MPRKKVFLLIALLAVLALLGASFGGLLFVGDTGSEFLNPNGWKTRGWFYSNTELLDSTRYVSSMDSDGFSENILASYQVCPAGPTGWTIMDAPDGEHAGNALVSTYYLDGTKLFDLKYPVSKFADGIAQASCWTLTIPFDTKLQGPTVGWLVVEEWTYMRDLGNPFAAHGFYKLAEDRAQVVSGSGDCILVGGDQAPFAPGAQITAQCDIGHAASGKEGGGVGSGWSLYGDWTSEPIASLGNGPAFSKRVTFTGPTETGMHEVRLYNGLFNQAKRVFTITTSPAEAPPPPVVSFEPRGPWTTGQTITLSWTASPNSETNAAIVQVHYDIFYVSGEEIATGSMPGAIGSVSFNTGGRDVDIRVAVVSEDANGQFSAPTQPTTAVEGCDLHGTCDGGDGDGDFGEFVIPVWAILLAIAIILLLLAAFVGAIPVFPWRVIIALVGAIFVLTAVLVFPG